MQSQAVTPSSVGYERAILDEVAMLLDYVAGCPAKTLLDLEVFDDAAASGRATPVPAVLARITGLQADLDNVGDGAVAPPDISFLLLARDALNALIRPASGLTVAYTAMVVGNRRGEAVRSRAVLAERAYAGLGPGARLHRFGQYALLAFALLITIVTVWDSTKVALGKSLLHNLVDLRAKQEEVSREKARLEQVLVQPGVLAAGLTIRLCDRSRLLFFALPNADGDNHALLDAAAQDAVFGSPAEQDVCDRDRQLGDSFFLAHEAVNAYVTDWPAMAGAGFDFLATILRAVSHALCTTCQTHADPIVPLAADPIHVDSELLVAPILVVLGNYVLPVLFAMLGAAAFVILDFYGKLRQSLLAPDDHIQSWIRLVLGSVIGACIGLFFSASEPVAASLQPDLIGSLTLTASGVSFLAGFGVEGVFVLLRTLVKRVFGAEPA